MDTPEAAGSTDLIRQPEGRVALLYCTDLMFRVELQAMCKKADVRPIALQPGTVLPDGNILLVDLRANGDWESMIKQAVARHLPVVAFGPHVDVDGRQRAKAAGARRVLSNGNLSRDLPAILKEL